jgi:hypothetical protein
MKHSTLLAAALSLALAAPALAAGKAEDSLKDSLSAQTTRIWQYFKDKKADAFAAAVTDDFVNIDWSGVAKKPDVAGSIADYSDIDFKLDNFQLVKIDSKTALVTYHASFHGNYKGKQAGPTSINASDVYTNRGGKWLGILHTETAAPEGTP